MLATIEMLMLECRELRGFYLDHLNRGNLHRLLQTTRRTCLSRRFSYALARILLNAALVCLAIISIAPPSYAQSDRTKVKLVFSPPDQLQVNISARHPIQTWSFLNSYAGATGMAERVHNFRDDSRGVEPAAARKIAAGVFRADHPLHAAIYEVKLSLGRSSDAAHVSWLTSDGGVLMLADLLPMEIIQEGPLDASFDLPNGWEVSPLVPLSARLYSIEDPMNAVWSVGPSLKSHSKTVGGTRLEVVVSGAWNFRIERATEAAAKVFKKYVELTRFKLPSRSAVLIRPMPSLKGAETWQAQTRGSTLLLLIDQRADFKNWVGQLEVIFTHELLHLWVPNALNLKGDYDWFFEGFTLYQALLTALDLKVISFDEYLNTLGRVYDSYRAQPDRLSLTEASEQRWTGAASTVYDKGMLLAFLYDLKLRAETRGESELSDRYPELFRKYASKTLNANEAIMSVLISSPATEALLKSYVEGRGQMQLSETLKQHGIALETEGVHTYLKIAPNPTRDQLRVLKSLGYRQ